MCVLLAKPRLFLLGAVLAIFAGRGAIAFFLTGQPLVLLITIPAAAGVYWILRREKRRPTDLQVPPRYDADEILLDFIAFFFIIALFYVLRKAF